MTKASKKPQKKNANKSQKPLQKPIENSKNNNSVDMNIHWFPGHMMKTQREIEKNLKLIDVLVEITDARIPNSGRNPILSSLASNKPHILLLNKADYADKASTELWLKHYAKNGITAISCNCRSGMGLKTLHNLIASVAGERKYNSAVRVMAAGIPNSGKSSFINRMAGSKKTAVGDRPGVTRGKQWIAVGKTIEILDLPGILPPRLDDKQVALNLAYTGAVKDEIMDTHALACNLSMLLFTNHKDRLLSRYNIQLPPDPSGNDILSLIASSRGMVISGGELDTLRAASALLDDFRGGRIGKITLEKP